MRKVEADVAIVGAGTSGAYLAWRLGGAGYRCVVIEKEPLEKLGTQIGPFHMEEVAFERFDIPLPTGDELLHTVRAMTMWSPTFAHSMTFELLTLVMDKPGFIQRLHGYARDKEVEILEQTEVVGLIMEGLDLAGVRSKGPQGDVEVRARLVIDASGIDGVVRTLMTPGHRFETDSISNLDTIFVYMETWDEVEGDLEHGVNSYPYFQGWCAPGPGDTRIVGIGMVGSHEAARSRHRRFMETLPFKGKVVGCTGGRIPYRRPPYSLVENGLMVVGDAAFMNKPFSGEGVTSALTACRIAEDVASAALRRGDVSINALWPYNVGYFQGQGAKFAFLTASLPAMMSMSASEMDFFFTVPGVLTEEGALALQLEYEIKQDAMAGLKVLPRLAKALNSGEVSLTSLSLIARAGAGAGVIKRLYERFPETPARHDSWVWRVGPHWRRADFMKRRYFAKVGEQLRLPSKMGSSKVGSDPKI